MEETLSSGSKLLDQVLEGGYLRKTINSIYGPGGSGRTLLCMLCAFNTANKKQVFYFNSDNKLFIDRAKKFKTKKNFNNIIFLTPDTLEKQSLAIERLNEVKKIGLIVVDGISKLYRSDLNKKSFYDVNKELSLQMQLLRDLSKKHNIPILMVHDVFADLTEKEEVKIVGGRIIIHGSKCLIEIKKANKNNRILILKKHITLKNKELPFKIVETGIKELNI